MITKAPVRLLCLAVIMCIGCVSCSASVPGSASPASSVAEDVGQTATTQSSSSASVQDEQTAAKVDPDTGLPGVDFLTCAVLNVSQAGNAVLNPGNLPVMPKDGTLATQLITDGPLIVEAASAATMTAQDLAGKIEQWFSALAPSAAVDPTGSYYIGEPTTWAAAKEAILNLGTYCSDHGYEFMPYE